MPRHLSPHLLLAATLAAGPGSAAAAAPQAAPDAGTLLKTLRRGHPRLLVLDPDVARARGRGGNDPVARKYRDGLRRDAEKILGEPPVRYVLKGPRLLDQSRLCLRRVYTLAGLYRLDGDKKWAERAVKELSAAAAFPDWNPSHFLDTAEMTHAFAVGYDWLYPALSPEERALVKTAIVEKGLLRGKEAYEGTKPWKWWTGASHNWNQVCNGGLTLGALAVADEEPQLAAFIVASALKSLPKAMASFAPDGGWDEGPGYWAYTLDYTVPLIAGLETALGSDFGLAAAPGFDRTGAFRMHFVGPTRRPFNYADGGDGVTGGTPVMYWLGRRFRQPQLYAEGGGGALGLFWYEKADQSAPSPPLDVVFRGIDVAFLRSAWDDPDALFVGFKGGDNKANHSHLDLGTFVFDALGERWAADLGGDDYNLPGYFGKQRWTYYRLRTEGQNSPLLDGGNQATDGKAPLVAFLSKPGEGFAVADLTGGYREQATRVWRGVALVDGRRSLLVQDEWDAAAPGGPVEYRWQMHTRAQVQADGAQATLTIGSKTVTARVLSPAGATFAAEPAAAPEPQNQNRGVTRLVVRLPGKATTGRVAVLLTPQRGAAGGGEPAAAAAVVRPLDEWRREAGPLPETGGAVAGKK